jgi:exodeoxyribonuclease V gamma subunit
MRPGSILEGKEKNKQARAETLTTLWLNHLVACASGTPTTSVQIGLNGAVQLDALPQKDAHNYLHDLILLYAEAWQQPLPLSSKSACKYLSTLSAPNKSKSENPDQLHTAALIAARQAFEGGHKQVGEFTKSASLQRVFKNFSDIEADLPFWAQRLYGVMVQQAKLVMTASTAMDEESAL